MLTDTVVFMYVNLLKPHLKIPRMLISNTKWVQHSKFRNPGFDQGIFKPKNVQLNFQS